MKRWMKQNLALAVSAVLLAGGTVHAEAADVSSFQDVSKTAYYAQAVDWAVEEGVTQGTGNGTFSPDATITRAEAVTFLWRAAGSPAPETSTSYFSDVTDQSAYYYKAVLWAVEQGITNGTGEGIFNLTSTLSYDQILTFLCRFAGEEASGSNWSAAAIDWARDNGLTDGLTFTAKTGCPRSDVVYCLWKQLGDRESPQNTKEDGSESYPWRIDSAAEFEDVLEQMSDGKKLDDAFLLTKDITLDSPVPAITTFVGTLDGGGYTLQIETDGGLPLFYENKGSIKNLSVVLDDRITFDDSNNTAPTSLIAALNFGMIDNCSIAADITVKNAFNNSWGLFTSTNRGIIQDCSATGEILLAKNVKFANVGGITGSNASPNLESKLPEYHKAGQIMNCQSSVNIKVDANCRSNGSDIRLGGITGWNGGVIKECTAQTFLMTLLDAYIWGADTSNLIYQGGITGVNADVGTVQNCTASGSLFASSYLPAQMYLNGISGRNNGTSKDNINNIGNSNVEQNSGSSAWANQTTPTSQNLAADGKPNCILCQNTGLRDCIYCRGEGEIVDPFYNPLKDGINRVDCHVCYGTGKVPCLCGRGA